VTVCFVDIGGIDDHHRLHFPFLKIFEKFYLRKKKAQTGKIHSDDTLSLHCLITAVFLAEK
jgi:hypothetical protein